MKKDMPAHIPETILALLIEQSSRDLSAAESQQVTDWYEGLELHTVATLLTDETMAATEKEQIWAHLAARLPAPAARRFWLRPLIRNCAAAILLMAALGGGWAIYRQLNQPYKLELATSKGKVQHITLPDGSGVWLSVDSRLRYNNWETGKPREVMLEGEAFFDIAKQAGQPFIIHTTALDIHVLGTSFNVKAYKEDATTETTLLSGAVQVVLKQEQNRKVQLAPSQKLVVKHIPAQLLTGTAENRETRIANNVSYQIEPAKVFTADSSFAETSWKDHKLAFFDQPFEEVARQLHRWYGVTVVFNNETMKKARFTGTFRDEPLPRVMMALQLSAPFKYQLNNDTLMIDK
ncbi:FecR family protein [Chitinophaga nivalis]|uniref:FecR family protein n=1 Tax=Chitinophaga nivalis TaxID=2991709 RepID=A0ABT3IWV2_9BACT|nr:FecR family protein [Chitinophaga nivalis]MCW3462108.1 FecR family protein [Chitinophaga nivalis]MCW3488200.1 FecR family protein [Chitinophaga nivalis]